MTPQFTILLITGGLMYNTYYDNYINCTHEYRSVNYHE
jgi:hypothetical protein